MIFSFYTLGYLRVSASPWAGHVASLPTSLVPLGFAKSILPLPYSGRILGFLGIPRGIIQGTVGEYNDISIRDLTHDWQTSCAICNVGNQQMRGIVPVVVPLNKRSNLFQPISINISRWPEFRCGYLFEIWTLRMFTKHQWAKASENNENKIAFACMHSTKVIQTRSQAKKGNKTKFIASWMYTSQFKKHVPTIHPLRTPFFSLGAKNPVLIKPSGERHKSATGDAVACESASAAVRDLSPSKHASCWPGSAFARLGAVGDLLQLWCRRV